MAINASVRGRNRVLIAQEAARIIAQEGVKDFRLAKRKASERLGLRASGDMPRNSEVQEAVKEYQRLFGGELQAQHLALLRSTAIEAMRFFARFRPRLVGAVLTGTAGNHSAVELHLFADTPEEVVLFLLEQGIPHESSERRFRLSAEGYGCYPVYVFAADQVGIDLCVFPPVGLRRPPMSPVDGKPMQRVDLAGLERMSVGPLLAS